MLSHLISSSTTSCPSSSTCSSFAGVSHHHRGRQMLFSSSSYSMAPFLPCPSGIAGETDGDAAAVSLGFDPASLIHIAGGRMGPTEVDFDPYDGESEEGVEVSEEPVKPAPPRTSGSKRSRAAEVHNLSEKRRRSRINEKMKALQNLIPNSNKTDKASMLDEAIEYLKQLQLQVQMLSMRNGLSLHPMYLPVALQPLQASQTRLGFDVDNGSLMNVGVGMLPVNQDSSAHNSFGLPNQCRPSHEPIITSANAEASFRMEVPQSHQGPFHVSMPAEEIYTERLVPQQQLDMGHTSRNLPEHKMKSMAATTTSPHFDGQASRLEGTDQLEACMLSREMAGDVLPRDQDHQLTDWKKIPHSVM